MGDCLSSCFEDESENNSYDRRRGQQSFSSQSSQAVLVHTDEPRSRNSNTYSYVLQSQRSSAHDINRGHNSRARTPTRPGPRERRPSTGSSLHRHRGNRSSSTKRITPKLENNKCLSTSDTYHHFHLEPVKLIPKDMLKKLVPTYWTHDYNEYGFILREIGENHPLYFRKMKLFERTTQENLKLEKIEIVENIYLWLSYSLKLEENNKNPNDNRNEYFHGTSSDNIDSICLHNLNWRKFGQNKGYKFGQGVCFAINASYASFYTDENESGNKMLLVQVINTKQCEGDEDSVLPPDGFDTTCNQDGKVYVKYEDNTFYPQFIFTYGGKLEHKQNKENVIPNSFITAHNASTSSNVQSMKRNHGNQMDHNKRPRL